MMEVSPAQPLNVSLPIYRTVSGINTDSNSVHSKKARFPIEAIDSGMTVLLQPIINLLVDVSIIALQ